MYSTKNDIASTVLEYHKLMHHDLIIIENDACCYYVHCKEKECTFCLNFNFKWSQFKPPSIIVSHNYELTLVSVVLGQIKKSRYLASLVEVQNWMHQEGRNADTQGLSQLLSRMGIDALYMVIY